MESECIYDSVIRESRVRGLQSANEKLEEELDAAKLLLKQVATGPDHTRILVLEYLEDSKQPLEIIQLLKDNGAYDSPLDKVENMKDSRGHTNGVLPLHPSATENTNFVKEEVTLIQPEQPIPEDGSRNGMGSTTLDPNLMHPTMLCSPIYTLSTNSASNHPEFTTPWMDNVRCPAPESIELIGSQHQIPLLADSAEDDFSHSIDPTHPQGPMVVEGRSNSLFFKPLFDRTDCLLTSSPIHQKTNIDNHEGANLRYSPPFLPQTQPIDFHNTPGPNVNGSLQPGATTLVHSVGEQLPASLRLHPNYGNNFGNLSLSNSVRANGYPRHVQDTQIRNIFVPNWAATMLNAKPHPGGLDDAFGDVYKKATKLLEEGEPLSRIIGPHPNIAALYDQQEFDKACFLSQWAARMVHSVKLQGYDFTCFASMNIFWYLMRWIIDPRPETYTAIPEWIRPRPSQLFTPHISMADFVLWPELRELVVQLPEMQERMGWLADMSMFIKCDWPYELEQALHRNPTTGLIDLVDLAKV
ncbi:hypothetical protein NW762_011368 [Fusarium torreyae]|uniref:Uncharacterized protein n=1 Tax=Fusarium torreyae TaxID=1237075 RepID=A0A9W8RSZ5_9HYPO|nr:hypothetical protein NW762_011368 [Fusarium torreyae]